MWHHDEGIFLARSSQPQRTDTHKSAKVPEGQRTRASRSALNMHSFNGQQGATPPVANPALWRSKNNYWLPHSVTSVNTFLLRTISSLSLYGKEREVCWSQKKKRIIQDKCQSILLHSQIHSLLITSTSKQPEASQASIVAVGNIVTPVLGGGTKQNKKRS